MATNEMSKSKLKRIKRKAETVAKREKEKDAALERVKKLKKDG